MTNARTEITKPAQRRTFPQRVRPELTVFGGVAVLVGLVTALGSYAFHLGIENGMIGENGQIVLHLVTGQAWTVPVAWWSYLLVPALPVLGLIAASSLVRFMSGGERGHGVAGVMEAVALRGGRLPTRPAIGRILASVLTIVSGGSVGPEDPNVQIGSTIASWLGQRLHFSDERVQTLVACGAASGIAAAFNAPIAGVFFAQEIILGEFSTTAFGMVVLSSVTSSVITRILRGESPAFAIPEYSLRSPWELFLYLGLGLLAAVISAAFVRGFTYIEDLAHHWRAPFLVKAALGGLAVGAVGLAFPNLYGVGYETMESVLQGQRLALWLLLALMLLKPLLTSTSLAAGGSGGVFAPSIFIGSILGGAFGQVVHGFLPTLTAPAPAYALVGMGGVLAGAVHCPITAILLLFEMTHDYRIILPIMLCAVVSTLISRWLSPGSVYTERLIRRGIYLHLGRDLNVMEMVTVEEAMTRDFDAMRPEMTLQELAQVLEKSTQHGFPVVNAQGQLIGIVTRTDYQRALEEGRGQTVADIYTRDTVTLFPDQSLNDAMRLLASRGVGQLPVVPRDDPRQIIGLLRRHDTIRAYNQGLTRRMEIEQRIQHMRLTSYRGGELMTLDLSPEAASVGRWVRDLNLPFGTIIVSILRGERRIIPRGDTALAAGDRVVLMVENTAIGEKVRALLLEGKGLPRGRETRYGEYALEASAPAVGKRIAELGLPRDSLVVSVKRRGRTSIAHGDTVLDAGDRVVVFAEDEDLSLVEHCLLGVEVPPGPEFAFKNILVPLDGSEHGWLALEQALEVASHVGGTIHGLFVIEDRMLEQPYTYLRAATSDDSPLDFADGPEKLEALCRARGEQVLAEMQRRCQEQGVDSIGTIRRGQLVDAVAQEDVSEDFITLAYQGREQPGFPSALEQVIRRSDRPVLVAVRRPRAIGRLLVAYDGGQESRQALHLAAQMARAFGSPLDVLGVQESDEDVESLLQQAASILSSYGVEATRLQRHGITSDQIVAVAREQQSDLILVGVYRHNHLRRALLGCTLDNLLRKTALPLLVSSRKEL
jgi:CIC family chloride channel protein